MDECEKTQIKILQSIGKTQDKARDDRIILFLKLLELSSREF